MLLFRMWDDSVSYEGGWFVYADGEGHCSIVSQQRARDLERRFLEYQAMQDFQRGGTPRDIAYSQRGFVAVSGGDGCWRFELAEYAADSAALEPQPVELAGTVVIPQRVGQFDIDTVSDEAFAGCDLLEKVFLPESVVSIGKRAFFGCSRLAEIAIPKGLVSIGANAFEGTSLRPAGEGSRTAV